MERLNEDELEFDFFEEPDTAETIEQGWRLPRLQRAGRDGGGVRRVPPPGLVGVGRLAGLAAIVIAATVGLVTGLGACQGPRADYAGYLRLVGVLARSSSKDGGQLVVDLSSRTATSSILARRLQDLASREQQHYDQAVQMNPPGPLRAVHGELVAAFELRASSLAELGQTFARPRSNKSEGTAEALTAQARLLTTSDVVWSQLYQVPVTQELHTLHITGVAVPQSRFVSNPALVTAPAFTQLVQRMHGVASPHPAAILKPGSTGAAVKAWQQQLNRWLRTQPGQTLLPIDGAFGAQTTAATKTLQQTARITADGIVGPTTRQALTNQLTGSG